MRFGVLACCLVLLAASALARKPTPKTDPVSDVTEIGVGVTPGKPMELARPGEAAETVVARKVGTRFVLEVSRNVAPDHQDGKADLTAAEWRALTAIVAQKRLRTWRPQQVPGGPPPDYATTTFWIKGKTQTTQTIGQPVGNAGGPAALGAKLGELAKAKVPSPDLHYFGF
jgi:hypothetical protein